MTRRDDREYREYLREEQRSQPEAPTARTVRRGVERGCIAGRMQRDFHHGLLGDDTKPPSGGGQPFVAGPERVARRDRRCEQVDVNPPEALAHQRTAFDEHQHLRVGHGSDLWQVLQEPEDFAATLHRATRELPDDEGMGKDLFLEQERHEARVAGA